jgi:hypothetical protein
VFGKFANAFKTSLRCFLENSVRISEQQPAVIRYFEFLEPLDLAATGREVLSGTRCRDYLMRRE